MSIKQTHALNKQNLRSLTSARTLLRYDSRKAKCEGNKFMYIFLKAHNMLCCVKNITLDEFLRRRYNYFDETMLAT